MAAGTAPDLVPETEMSEDGILRPTFHHVNLKTTTDGLQRLIDWYGTVVGTTPTFQYPMGAWLSNDRANHRIAILALPQFAPDPEQAIHTGLHHTAFEYDSLEKLMASYERLRDLGIVPFFAMDHGLTMSIYYLDPDGNAVELQVDNYGSWDASTEFMRSALEFRQNPLGVFFDPELVVEALRSGASHEDIHQRAFAAQYLPDPIPDIGAPEMDELDAMPKRPVHTKLAELPSRVDLRRSGRALRSAQRRLDRHGPLDQARSGEAAAARAPVRSVSFVLQGTMEFDIDGEIFLLGPGEVLSIPADAPHTARIIGDETVINVDARTNARRLPVPHRLLRRGLRRRPHSASGRSPARARRRSPAWSFRDAVHDLREVLGPAITTLALLEDWEASEPLAIEL